MHLKTLFETNKNGKKRERKQNLNCRKYEYVIKMMIRNEGKKVGKKYFHQIKYFLQNQKKNKLKTKKKIRKQKKQKIKN